MDYRFDDTNRRRILHVLKQSYPEVVSSSCLLKELVTTKIMAKQTLFNQLTYLLDNDCIRKPYKGYYLFHKDLDKTYVALSSYVAKYVPFNVL